MHKHHNQVGIRGSINVRNECNVNMNVRKTKQGDITIYFLKFGSRLGSYISIVESLSDSGLRVQPAKTVPRHTPHILWVLADNA
jgi:hypothetical protein